MRWASRGPAEAFDSQTKETLTTKRERFGSSCELSAEFLQSVVDSGVIESLKQWPGTGLKYLRYEKC